MISNKKTLDPDLVYDGAVLIWNIGVIIYIKKINYKVIIYIASFLECNIQTSCV